MPANAPRCKRVKLDDPHPLVNRDARAAQSFAAPIRAAPARAIRKYFFLGARRASAKAAAQLLGESRYQREVAAARVAFYADPDATYTIDTPGGRLTIVFRTV